MSFIDEVELEYQLWEGKLLNGRFCKQTFNWKWNPKDIKMSIKGIEPWFICGFIAGLVPSNFVLD